MYLNIFEDFGKWFNNVARPIKSFFKPISDWFYRVTGPIRSFITANERNPFLWVGIILIGLIVFELTYRALHKDR